MFSGGLGVHWIVDAIDCRSDDLADEAHLEAVLTEIPDALHLVRVERPRTFHHEEEGEITLAGIVLISASHFSIHVRPHLRVVHADLFSCRPFDVRLALELLKQAYGFTRYEEQTIERGKKA